MATFSVKDLVKWKWMGGKVHGAVVEIFTESVVKEIKGKQIKRNGTIDKPAYFVISEAGNYALKLESELEAASSKKNPVMES